MNFGSGARRARCRRPAAEGGESITVEHPGEIVQKTSHGAKVSWRKIGPNGLTGSPQKPQAAEAWSVNSV